MSAHSILLLLWMLVLLHILVTWWSAIRRGWRARQNEGHQPQPLPEDLPPVSVVVPAWNECGTIERNIGALQKVNYPCWQAVIVAGGNDGTFAAACQKAAGDDRFRILERGPEPKNAALNRGIQAAQHDILVLLDADNIVEPAWLSALIAPIVYGASVSVGHSLPNRITWVTLEERMWHIRVYQILKLSWIQGDRSIAIRRSLLDRIGGLPTHTFAREDWDIWARLDRTGERVVFAKDAYLVTDRPATLSESWRHQVRWRRTHLTGMWEHRQALLHKPAQFFSQFYGYVLSMGLSLGCIVALCLVAGWPASRPVVFQLVLLTSAWLCFRRAALGAEVAAFTGDRAWLLRAWMPAVTLGIDTSASVVALFSRGKQTPLYKGPRHTHP